MVKRTDFNQKTKQSDVPIVVTSPSAGPEGLALAPPIYGVNVIDGNAEDSTPDTIGDQSQSVSENTTAAESSSITPLSDQPVINEKDEQDTVRQWVAQGGTNEILLTNRVYFRRHPEADRQERVAPGSPEAKEWISIRNRVVHPSLGQTSTQVKTAKPAAKKEFKKADSHKPEDILENIQHDAQSAQEDERALRTRFHEVMQVLKQKVNEFIANVPSKLRDTSPKASPDTTSLTQPTPPKSNGIRDVLKSAMEIETELTARHKDLGKGGWVLVTDDPQGVELSKLHETQYRHKKIKDKKVQYEVWQGGFYSYGPATKKVNGKKTATDQYVCTTFVDEALERAGFTVDSQQVNINVNYEVLLGKKAPKAKKDMSEEEKKEYSEEVKEYEDAKKKKLRELVEKEDPKIQGMVTALVSAGQGKAINIKEVEPGDLVQFWHGLEGHAVIVQQRHGPYPDGSLKITFYGSHKSKGGIGYLKEMKVLKKGGEVIDGYKFFAVRPKGGNTG